MSLQLFTMWVCPFSPSYTVVCSRDDVVTSRGYYEWPQTYPSDTAELKCTMGGTATRYCSLTGRWERPDVSDCVVSAAALFKYLKQVCCVCVCVCVCNHVHNHNVYIPTAVGVVALIDYRCPIFIWYVQHPFSEENFSELLYAVELVKIEGGEAKQEYMEVVNSYFRQLTEKLDSDRSFRFTSEVSNFK